MTKKAFSLSDDDRAWSKLKSELAALSESDTFIKAGVVGEAASEQRDGGITNAELATIHEFGAPKAHVPERSFVRSSFDANRAEYEAELHQLTCRLYKGDLSAAQLLVELDALGKRVAEDIRKRIEDAAVAPPDSDATDRRKVERGAGERTLIDTGGLVRAIGHAVVKERK